jgi:hypothetical protein
LFVNPVTGLHRTELWNTTFHQANGPSHIRIFAYKRWQNAIWNLICVAELGRFRQTRL